MSPSVPTRRQNGSALKPFPGRRPGAVVRDGARANLSGEIFAAPLTLAAHSGIWTPKLESLLASSPRKAGISRRVGELQVQVPVSTGTTNRRRARAPAMSNNPGTILSRMKDEEIDWVDLRFTDPKGK